MKTKKNNKEYLISWYEDYPIFWYVLVISFFVCGVVLLGIGIIYDGCLDTNLDTKNIEEELEDHMTDIISDSCNYGCIHSTRYYYNCSGVNFEEAAFECMNECIKLSSKIGGLK